jgi:hypothetical protein
MALLDLQGMVMPATEDRGGKSAASKGCGNNSGVSLLLC